jgi:xanthine dehydrogenase small subunit
MTESVHPLQSQTLSFVLDGTVVHVRDAVATMTVLEYLRGPAGRCGTKEGCAEGDCGACTVVLGELADDGSGIHYQAINSCIRFLPTIHGKELVTVEGLRGPNGAPHPVQQAMVDSHASQCGFCTPGFVMSLFALYLSRDSVDRSTVVDTLSGNLCRCTGYRPIIDAGVKSFGYPTPVRWSRADAQSEDHRNMLRAVGSAQSLNTTGFHSPRTLEELATAVAASPNAILLAGGTDVGLWVTKELRELPPIIHLCEVTELRNIEHLEDRLTIGAAVTLSRAWPALVALYPTLAEQAERFASPPIRNSATLCGNLANGSPIGDSLPAMLALDASLELRRGRDTRLLPISEFYLGYRKTALRSGEFIARVHVPLPQPYEKVASYKVAKRHDQDISAVSATFRVALNGDRVEQIRLAFGGMAQTARRATTAESVLLGKPWSMNDIEAAGVALSADFSPLSDLRASSAYRMQVARNLLRRFYLQSQGETATLPNAPLRHGEG